MRKRPKGVTLHRETLHRLERPLLRGAAGGTDTAGTCARSECQGSCMTTCYLSMCATYCDPCY
jgi:hypothetical protein